MLLVAFQGPREGLVYVEFGSDADRMARELPRDLGKPERGNAEPAHVVNGVVPGEHG